MVMLSTRLTGSSTSMTSVSSRSAASTAVSARPARRWSRTNAYEGPAGSSALIAAYTSAETTWRISAWERSKNAVA